MRLTGFQKLGLLLACAFGGGFGWSLRAYEPDHTVTGRELLQGRFSTVFVDEEDGHCITGDQWRWRLQKGDQLSIRSDETGDYTWELWEVTRVVWAAYEEWPDVWVATYYFATESKLNADQVVYVRRMD